jgi:hypothetical protein
LLPSLLEGLVARNLQDGLGLAEAPEVNLVSDPAPSVLWGRFEEGEITLTNPEFGGVRPDEVMIDLEPFDIDVRGSVASGRPGEREAALRDAPGGAVRRGGHQARRVL